MHIEVNGARIFFDMVGLATGRPTASGWSSGRR